MKNDFDKFKWNYGKFVFLININMDVYLINLYKLNN